ncbi:unnamed protein product, partial [Meganyctiphanes norvegica]
MFSTHNSNTNHYICYCDIPESIMSAQLLNTTERCVDDCLLGITQAHPGLVLLPEQRVVVDGSCLISGAKPRVRLVSGGGSGHEPFPVGFIGEGMLSAAVCGPVFTSPPPSSVAAAIAAVGKKNTEGVLVVVLNYTGDRINFGLALERCRSAGIKVEMHVSGDDSALSTLSGTAGRRGLCGTLFTFKIAGAMAARGSSLQDIVGTCQRLAQATGTIGVASSGCRMPGAAAPLFNVEDGHLELGLGVHGEAGAATLKAGSASEVMSTLLKQLTRADSASRLDIQRGDNVAVIVNNLGGTSEIEMAVMTKEVIEQLKNLGVKPQRVYIGGLMTSLDMRGIHISVLRLQDSQWLTYLDDPTSDYHIDNGFLHMGQGHSDYSMIKYTDLGQRGTVVAKCSTYELGDADAANAFRKCLESVVKSVPFQESHLNALDAGCGDGDCGATLCSGLSAMSKLLGSLDFQHPSSVLSSLGEVASSSMGGSSGGLYSILFTAAANNLQPGHAVKLIEKESWVSAFRAGLDAVSKYGGANKGDRTMLDALLPACEALKQTTGSLTDILVAMAAAADKGAKATTAMTPRVGRASYVRASSVTGEDAGARAVACILKAMA